MKNYSALIFLFVLTFLMASCDKDDEPTKEDRLRAKNWKVTAIKISGELNGSKVENYDYYNLLGECQKDDVFKFNTGGVAVVDDGVKKCIPTAPQTTQGTWSYKENPTGDILTVGGNILNSYNLGINASKDLTVVTLNNETLGVTFKENISLTLSGLPITIPGAIINITFTAQ